MPYAIAQQQTDYINKLIQQRRKQWINENGPCKNGTISGYYRHRCRCGLCKLAYSQYRKTIRSK